MQQARELWSVDSAQQRSGVAGWHRQKCSCWVQHKRNRTATAWHNITPRPHTCGCTRHPTAPSKTRVLLAPTEDSALLLVQAAGTPAAETS